MYEVRPSKNEGPRCVFLHDPGLFVNSLQEHESSAKQRNNSLQRHESSVNKVWIDYHETGTNSCTTKTWQKSRYLMSR